MRERRSPTMSWLFNDPPNVAVFTTKMIVAGEQPVLLVTHDDDDGAWQFLPLKGELDERNAAVVSLREMIERDGTLAQLVDLPLGWRAWRQTPNDPWRRERCPSLDLGSRTKAVPDRFESMGFPKG